MFYAYGYPRNFVSNLASDGLYWDRFSSGIMFDETNRSFLVALVDEPDNPRVDHEGRTIEGFLTTTSPLGPGAVFEDDPHEVTWNEETRAGTFEWNYGPCCSDGFVIGPFPEHGWCATWTLVSYPVVLTHVDFNSYVEGNPPSTRLLSVPFPPPLLVNGVNRSQEFSWTMCVHQTQDYCSTLTTCGLCTTAAVCQWCDQGGGEGFCAPASITNTCSELDPTSQLVANMQCCPACVALQSDSKV